MDGGQAGAGQFTMGGVVVMFEVVEHQIHGVEEPGKDGLGHLTASVESGVETALAAAREEQLREFGLGARFAAGQGDPAAGGIEPGTVGSGFGEEFLEVAAQAQRLHGLRRTRTGAGLAAVARAAVDEDSLVASSQRARRAGWETAQAADAVPGGPPDFGHEPAAFGVVTPAAAQGAAFEEKGGANPGPVMG